MVKVGDIVINLRSCCVLHPVETLLVVTAITSPKRNPPHIRARPVKGRREDYPRMDMYHGEIIDMARLTYKIYRRRDDVKT